MIENVEELVQKIVNKDLRQMVTSIVQQYWQILVDLPASISLEYHNGETCLGHIEQVIRVCESLCLEFNVLNDDKDVVLSAAILHDISQCLYTSKDRVPEQFQKLYVSGYNRSDEAYLYHPTLSAFIVGKYIIDNKRINPLFFQVAKLVQSHMSHWLQQYNTKPESLLEFILCTADYIVTRKDGKL